MKTLLFIAALFSSVLFLCCNKSANTGDDENLGIVGNWILSETLADPGDGSGKWTVVDLPNKYYIKFNSDGSLESNTSGRFASLKGYKLINDSSINFFYADGTGFNLFYKITGNALTITGGCIEACGSKFTRKTI